jgi:hypothetical protein
MEVRIMNKKTLAAGVALACVMLAPIVIAAEGVVGEWEFRSKFEARTSDATMTIKKTAEGKYEGTWSAQWGESTLSDITFENGSLKFVQTSDFGGRESKTTYEAKVEAAKLSGTGKGPFGEFTIDGALSAKGETSPKGGQGEPNAAADTIVGEWQLNITVPAREIVDKLIISKNEDGTLAGKWVGQRGESTISNMKFEGGKLTFIRKSKMGAMEFEMAYEGTVEGDQIKGVFRSERGDREANATRVVIQPQTGKEESKEKEPNKPK